MIFRFTVPAVNLRNSFLAMLIFFVVVFQVYVLLLQSVSITESKESTSALFEDFISGTPQVALPSLTGNTTNTGNTTQCIPFNPDLMFEPTVRYHESTTLPQWMKDYFDWHREQTSKINSCNYKDFKYLVLRCSNKERKCGGVADRLKSLPFFVGAGAVSKRIFLIRWERPAKLEEFLIPNEINWSNPDWMHHPEKFDPKMYMYLPTGKELHRAISRYPNAVFLEGLLQDFYGGSKFYHRYDSTLDDNKELDTVYLKEADDYTGWTDYEMIFRDLFFTVFKPSPPVAKLVREHMESSNLVPGKFSTSHYRAFYAVEHKKHVRTKDELKLKTENALNCASVLQPGDPVYFASDSHVAVLSASEMASTTNRKIVVFDDEKEALHLDKRGHWKSGNVSDFYPTFVDLLVMAESKCISHGVGGYGRFANILSFDPSCLSLHDWTNPGKALRCNWADSKDDIAKW